MDVLNIFFIIFKNFYDLKYIKNINYFLYNGINILRYLFYNLLLIIK